MKKFLILAMIAVLVMTTACGTKTPTPEETSSETPSSSTSSVAPESTPESTPEEVPVETTLVYGKVVSVVGNELEINTGTPEVDVVGDLSKEEEVAPPVEEEEEDKKDEVITSMILTPAQPSGGDFVTGGEVETNEPMVGMTYGEETQELTVPVGIPFNDLLAKGRIGFDQIKEGSVICVEMTGDVVSQIYFMS